MNTIKERWDIFAAANVPPDAPAEQYYMMKSSFYGGAYDFLNLVEGIPHETSDDAVHAIIQGCMTEMTDYFESLQKMDGWPEVKE